MAQTSRAQDLWLAKVTYQLVRVFMREEMEQRTVSEEAYTKAVARYHKAMRAMQSGVAAKMKIAPSETTPKSLRVGVNSAMLEHSALVQLLWSKGIIDKEEYYSFLANAAEQEVTLYEAFLSMTTPNNPEIKLH